MNEKFMNALQWVAARAEEPSTWAGGGIIAALLHQFLPDTTVGAIIGVGAAIGGLLAIVVPQPHNNPPLKVAPGVDLTKDVVVTQGSIPTAHPVTEIKTDSITVSANTVVTQNKGI